MPVGMFANLSFNNVKVKSMLFNCYHKDHFELFYKLNILPVPTQLGLEEIGRQAWLGLT